MSTSIAGCWPEIPLRIENRQLSVCAGPVFGKNTITKKSTFTPDLAQSLEQSKAQQFCRGQSRRGRKRKPERKKNNKYWDQEFKKTRTEDGD